MRKGKSEAAIVKAILDHGTLTLSDLTRLTGYSKSWTWKVLQRLAMDDVVTIDKRGGTLLVKPGMGTHRKLLRVAILRATEYLYIIPFIKELKKLYNNIEILVYDEAFKLAYDIAIGKVHLGMAPVVSHLLIHRISGGGSFIIGGGSGGGAGLVIGDGGIGHATTMASSMELCAELQGLPGPRRYYSSGDSILSAVQKGEVKYGVLWQPYLVIASSLGLRVKECSLPFCCLLGANKALIDQADKIRKAFEKAVRDAKRRVDDPILLDAYSNLVGFDPNLVYKSVKSYKFYENPPIDLLRQYWRSIREVAFPERVLIEAVLH